MWWVPMLSRQKDQLKRASTSFSQVLNDYRHQLSIRLLLETDESIAEIVYLTGFAEPSTFYRAFNRWEGVTPIEFRAANRKTHR
jgi:AraC-like DNA-binding protein